MSVDNMYSYIENQITTICAKHTPERVRKENSSTIPRNRLVLIRKRKKLSSQINFIKYVLPVKPERKLQKLTKKKFEIEEQMKELIKEELMRKELAAIAQIKKNPKFVYSYSKKHTRGYSLIQLRDGRIFDSYKLT